MPKTIEEHLPDETSLCDMSESEKEQVITISWKKDILNGLMLVSYTRIQLKKRQSGKF